jgi:GDP-4-dehydro-6-deoxy-D-mannose reductase
VKALVTGAQGFVGRHLVVHLGECGDDVVGIDHECDVTDEASMREVLQRTRPDAIYHLAALSHVGSSWLQQVEFTRVNVLGTRNVLERAREHVPDAVVVVVSSANVYGVVRPDDLPLVESFRLAPSDPYASSKVGAELVALDAVSNGGSRVVIARPFNHIGPGQSDMFVVPAIVNRLLESLEDGSDEIVVGDLTTRRDFCDVRDVVRAYRLLVEHGVSGEAYNIASGRDVSLQDIADQLVATIAPHVRLVRDEELLRPAEIPVLRGSYEKLRAQTGWEPRIPLRQSLSDVVADMRLRRSAR